MYQSTELIGNLGRDPEMRYTPKGTAVTTFSMATKGRDKKATWWRVTTWGELAETCNKYLVKGRPVHVVGEIQSDENGNPTVFQRKDGSWSSGFEITARTVTFLGKGSTNDAAQPTKQDAQDAIDDVFQEQELPF